MARKKRKPERPPRRKPNTGAIRHKRGREAPWEAEWKHQDSRLEYRYFADRSQAAEWLDALVEKRKTGKDTTAGGLTLQAYLEKWLTIKSDKIEPKTAHTYRYYAELILSEDIGIAHVRIDALTLEHMEHALARLRRSRFRQNIHELFGVLDQAFAYARRSSLKWMTVNPLDGLEIPSVERRKNMTLTHAQRTKMLEVATAEHDPDVPLCPLWHLYSRLGLRKGEGIALEWRDVDWQEKTLTIDESITNIGADNPRGKTKTKRTRIIPLPDDILEMLREHRAAQQRRGIFPSIFVDVHGETVTPQHVQYRWSLLRNAAGCPKTTIHDLRHTSLYLMAVQGIPDNIRMALAGHSSIKMAELYANHATIEDMRRAIS